MSGPPLHLKSSRSPVLLGIKGSAAGYRSRPAAWVLARVRPVRPGRDDRERGEPGMATHLRHGKRALVVFTMAVPCVTPGCVKRRDTLRTDPPGHWPSSTARRSGRRRSRTASRTMVTATSPSMRDDYQTLSVVQPMDAPWWDNILHRVLLGEPRPHHPPRRARVPLPPRPRRATRPSTTSSAAAMSSASSPRPRRLRDAGASSASSASDLDAWSEE